MVAKGLKLVKFEFDINGITHSIIAVTRDLKEDLEEMREYIINKIKSERENKDDIMLVSISDIGSLNVFSPSVERMLKEYFSKKRKSG